MRHLLLLAPLLLLPPAARAEETCPIAKIPALALPHLREAVASGAEVVVVAFGSSSTAGWRASDRSHSYPALLQTLLGSALPQAHIAVLNRGIGGQDVVEELPRMERDAIAVRPALVIWQVGANGAMRHTAPDLFKRLLIAGVHRLEEAHIDVILMDNQRAPAILASPEHVRIDQIMAEVSTATGAALFSRGTLMDQWRLAGYSYDMFVSDDGVHHNDHGYRCVSEALSRAIIDGLARPAPSPDAVATRR